MWNVKRGSKVFMKEKCPVPYCSISDRREDYRSADVVILKSIDVAPVPRKQNQIWMAYMLESPYVTFNARNDSAIFNWTATYRHDSTIVTPYEKFVFFNSSIRSLPITRNYAAGKTRKVAWFVSNCDAMNNRLEYAWELEKYIQVDTYGYCGNLTCTIGNSNYCFSLLDKVYKFYLSFENCNCRDYITEKFFVNGLRHDVVPIVMGAAPEDYARVAPPHSYIHVDQFKSPKELAEYLTVLDNDDDLYNEYFKWKGTGEFINTKFWCRVCALAHDVGNRGPSWYTNAQQWWMNNDGDGGDTCIGNNSWRNIEPRARIGDLPLD